MLFLLPINYRSLIILLLFFFFFVADKQFTTPNFNLVNCEDLNKIIRSEIFLHKDGQLYVAHIILGYKPISSSFQSPKLLIKAKDPRLLLIDIVVPGFLIGLLLEGTHNVNLIDHQIVELLQVKKEVIL